MPRRRTPEEFIELVHTLVGGEYTFTGTYKNNQTKLLCKHNSKKCENHEWMVTPLSFVNNGTRCPKCANNLKKTNEDFVKEVLYIVGSEYTFLADYKGAHIKLPCKHNTCGTVWEIKPNGFLSGGYRCPTCFGTPLKTNEEFTEAVRNIVGNEYIFNNKYQGAHIKLSCTHYKCNHTWYIKPHTFLNCGVRCPKCNESKGEREIARVLDKWYIPYVTQHTYDDCVFKNKLSFDFYLPESNVLIEFDGEQHFKPRGYGGISEKEATELYKLQRIKDKIKDKYCSDKGIQLVRIPFYILHSKKLEAVIVSILIQLGYIILLSRPK